MCCESQLPLRFFGNWSRRPKLIPAGLAIQGGEYNGRPFSQLQIKRIDQREDLAISNRLLRFQIRDCSMPAHFHTEQFCGFLSSKKPGCRKSHSLLIPSQLRVLCRGKRDKRLTLTLCYDNRERHSLVGESQRRQSRNHCTP